MSTNWEIDYDFVWQCLTGFIQEQDELRKSLKEQHDDLILMFTKLALMSDDIKFADAVRLDEIDHECIPLCVAINLVPGIRTFACCSGHFGEERRFRDEEYFIGIESVGGDYCGLDAVVHAINDARATGSDRCAWFLRRSETYFKGHDRDVLERPTPYYYLCRPPIRYCVEGLMPRDLLLAEVFKLTFSILDKDAWMGRVQAIREKLQVQNVD